MYFKTALLRPLKYNPFQVIYLAGKPGNYTMTTNMVHTHNVITALLLHVVVIIMIKRLDLLSFGIAHK